MVFPLGDDNSDRTAFPIVNLLLIAANVFVFFVLQGAGSNEKFTLAFSTVPAEIISGQDLVTESRVEEVDTEIGRQQVVVPGLQQTPIPVYLTLLTAIFMHGSLAHLGGNLWFLWIFGDNIENDLGIRRYIVFYLLCGLIAGLVHVMFSQDAVSRVTPCLGASGAISGVMGAYMVLHPHRTVTVLMFRFVTDVPGYVAVGLWFLFQIVSSIGVFGGMESSVAYGAHIGGFVAGAILARPFTIGRSFAPEPQAWRQVHRRGF
jgi:membrane associated rhomboid family serine protease